MTEYQSCQGDPFAPRWDAARRALQEYWKEGPKHTYYGRSTVRYHTWNGLLPTKHSTTAPEGGVREKHAFRGKSGFTLKGE